MKKLLLALFLLIPVLAFSGCAGFQNSALSMEGINPKTDRPYGMPYYPNCRQSYPADSYAFKNCEENQAKNNTAASKQMPVPIEKLMQSQK
ncbi:MAG: hypothetical protein ACYCSB_06945 [bacterium]